ncbi:MAG: hydroxyacylglutathione hydrolase, partial [Pseudomonadota bacterium]
GCTVYGPAREAGLIQGLDVEVKEGDTVSVGHADATVLDTAGHTRGHVSYYFPDAGVVFVGDTLFSVGCGKLLEGDAPTMWRSLSKLAALPPDTAVYCGHEYTGANCRFALTIEPENAALQARAAQVAENDAKGLPSLPTTIGLELATNPFLRAASPEIQARLGLEGQALEDVFGEVRRRKDRF